MEIDFHHCPCPEGCAENQFAPFRVRGKQIDFSQYAKAKKSAKPATGSARSYNRIKSNLRYREGKSCSVSAPLYFHRLPIRNSVTHEIQKTE
jgi:hypothetical protein